VPRAVKSLVGRRVLAWLGRSPVPTPAGSAERRAPGSRSDTQPPVFLEPALEAKLRSATGLIPNRETSPEDVFITGHPKSGNTWFQNLVAGVMYGVDPEYAPYSLVSDVVPGHMQVYYKRYGTPTFFKSHDLPRPRYRRVVYLVRDGRDVMVSYLHHMRAVRGRDVDFMRVVQADDVTWPYKWHEHVEAWLANPHAADMITIRYEALLEDTVRELRRFCAFVGVEREESFLATVARKASFKAMQRKEAVHGMNNPHWPKDAAFVRRGEAGSYRDEMPPAVLEAFLRDAAGTLRKLGYI